MRIISGKYRGKILNSPKNNDIRPTTDRAKESIFNMIQSRIYDSEFLDLFSGSGAIGIEAYSRGAGCVTLVEKNKSSLELINSNLNLIRYNKQSSDKCNILLSKSDVLDFLYNTNKKYDIIFADPPYEYEHINTVIDVISRKRLLNDSGIFVLESDKNFNMKLNDDMFVEKEKIYSISKITIIKER